MRVPPAKRSKNSSDHFSWKDEEITTKDGITYGIVKHRMNLHPSAYALKVTSKRQFDLKDLMKFYCKQIQELVQKRKEETHKFLSNKKSSPKAQIASLEYMETLDDLEEDYRNSFSLARCLSELERLLWETYYQLTRWRTVRDSMEDLADEKPIDYHDRYNILWLEEIQSSNKYHECKVLHMGLTSDIQEHLGDSRSNTNDNNDSSKKDESSAVADDYMINYTRKHYIPCYKCCKLFNSQSLGVFGRFRCHDESEFYCWECSHIEMKKEEQKFGTVHGTTHTNERWTPITVNNPDGIENMPFSATAFEGLGPTARKALFKTALKNASMNAVDKQVMARIAKQVAAGGFTSSAMKAALAQAKAEAAIAKLAATSSTTPDVDDTDDDSPPLPLHQEPVATKKKRKKKKKKKKKKVSALGSAETETAPEFEILPREDKRDDSIVSEKSLSKGNHEQLDTGTITTAESFSSSSQDFMEGSSSHEEEEACLEVKASALEDGDDSVNELLVEYLWKTNSILALAEYMDELDLAAAAQTSRNS